VTRSAFVDLVVVAIFARVQISLRSATFKDLLLFFLRMRNRKSERKMTYSFASIMSSGRG
jgi:hypothetical protein